MIEKEMFIRMARDARENAYAPYSEYKVGALLHTDRGTFRGANIEVSGRNTSVHAETMALFKAVMNGATEFNTLAISHEGDTAPCALCMHTLSEFMHDIDIVVDEGGDEYNTYSLADQYGDDTYRPQTAEHHDHH